VTQTDPAPAMVLPAHCEPDVKRQVLNRLRRAQGQLSAVIAAVEQDAECRAIVTQLSAVNGALERAGFAVVAANLRRSLENGTSSTSADGVPSEVDLSLEELERLFCMVG